MTQTYVYNGKEVYLTGRTAIKKAVGRETVRKQKILYEIRPIKYKDSDMGGINEWVQIKDLYEIDMEDIQTDDN